jgi:lysozyme family protein
MLFFSHFNDYFMDAVHHVFHWEGGLVEDPADPGGLTKYGISKRRYPHLDITHLTKQQARQIYYRDFWLKYNYDLLPPLIGKKMLSISVNTGPTAAHGMLQRALKSHGIDVINNGTLNQDIIDAANSLDESALLATLKSEAAAHYRILVAKKPVFRRFIRGWLNRAYG